MHPQQHVATEGEARLPAVLPAPFSCHWEWEGVRSAWVAVTGELDLATAPEFADVLATAQRDARLVVLDLGALSFMAIAGIQAIIDASRRAERDGSRLVLTRGPRHVHSTFVLTRTDDQVVFLDTV